MKPKEARSKVIDGILASRTDCKECKPVYEKYQKIFFKKTKEKFKQEHPEVTRYEKAAAYLAKHPDDKDSTQKELKEEQEKLVGEIAELKEPLTEVQADLKKLRDIRYWVRKATPGTEESKEPPKKQPIKEVLQDKADEKKAQRTAPAQTKHRQQDTVTTKAGNYFYILIDRANEDKETAVHFLNQVDDADLQALFEDGKAAPETCTCTTKCAAGAVNTNCPVCKTNMTECTGPEPEPQEPEETEQPQEDEAKGSGMGGLVVFLVVALIGGGAALYFFKFKKPKADTKGGDELDEYDFGEDEDDEDEPTPEDEEPAQDKEE